MVEWLKTPISLLPFMIGSYQRSVSSGFKPAQGTCEIQAKFCLQVGVPGGLTWDTNIFTPPTD